MKITKKQRNNIIFLMLIAVLIIPQTRQPIQILLHKGLALFSPSTVKEEKRKTISTFDWKLVDEHGIAYDFADANGKVVVINFWATWCPPCIAEMPSLEKLYQKYHKEVVFLIVSNEKQDVISAFKKKNNYEFLAYASVSEPPKDFDLSSIPRTYLIDKQGTIVIDKSGAADWYSEAVTQLLDDLLKTE